MVEDLNKYIKGVCDGSIFIAEDIKVGDIVRLKVGSRFNNGRSTNPIYTDGEVVDDNYSEGLKIRVRWDNDNGYYNSYTYNDLELIIR